MIAALLWLLPLEVLGLLAFPLAHRVFSRLPDRGWTLSKLLGLLLLSYGTWLVGLSHTIPNSRWSVLLALLALTALAVWAARSRWPQLVEFVREQRWTIILSEVLFLGLFAAWALYRANVPDIVHTEQPMDLSFLNSVVVSPHYPPNDPWLSGFAVSYYYFGYLMVGTLALLTGVATSVAYNLGLATVPALAGLAAFGLVFNLVRLSRGSFAAAALAGGATVYLLVVASNLEGTLELVRAAGTGGAGFWGRIGVEGLTVPGAASASWFPDEPGWWWWRASRVIPGAINEFPMFSFVLGDLHPHVMSIPVILLVVGLAVQLYLTPGLLGLAWLRDHWPLALALSLGVGSLAAINFVDLPLGVALMGGALLLHALRSGQHGRSLWRALAMLVVLVTAALVLFFPFYLTFETLASGILPERQLSTRPLHLVLMWGLPGLLALGLLAAVAGRLVEGVRRRWPQLLAAMAVGFAPVALWLQPVWGTIAYGVVAVGLVAAVGLGPFTAWLRPWWAGPTDLLAAASGRGSRFALRTGLSRAWALALAAAAVAAALGWLVADGVHFAGGRGPDAVAPGARMLVVVPLALAVAAAVYGAWLLGQRRETGPPSARPRRGGRRVEEPPPETEGPVEEGTAPVLGLLAVAAALVMGVELFYVSDIFGGALHRMNTVFKLYYQAWILLAVVGGYGLYYVARRWDLTRLSGNVGAGIWGLVLVIALGAVSYYPAAALYSRTLEGPSDALTLDGQAHLERSARAEYEAIRWIRSNAPRDAVVVEGVVVACGDSETGCSDWTDAGRIAASTGRPTVLGWMQHEDQWRSSFNDFNERRDDVRELYATPDPFRARQLLAKYDAEYVVVGPRERGAYGLDGLAKFELLGSRVFPEGPEASTVIVYQVAP